MRVYTDGLAGARRRSLARARAMDRGDRIAPSHSLTFESTLDLVKFLTAGRVRVVETVKERSMTISDLAKTLKRDVGAVSRDVTALEHAGLVRSRMVPNPGHGTVKHVRAAAEKITLSATL
jgi:predicted transcriptional regulator